VSKDGDLGELHSVNIERERVLSTINNSHLLNVHSIVSKEKVQSEEVDITLERLVIPHDIKAEDVAIVLEELGKASVWMTTS
jgi:hypothetical protein